ncbi:hypothetical protein DXG03_002636 [Asterophora parasitica]|uniref:Uncharacterized protein n=1 Tax=Asterophora parasitica TaxID=117018 RepID=A0A9P7KCA8_9AGAR|nr:hypothetical protein DXG03_002636 [Asterophora parasitica]
MDQAPVPQTFVERNQPPHLPQRAAKALPLPENTPSTLRELHAQLAQSPHLETSTLVVSEPIAPPPGPALPRRNPQGRRKRGGTYAGESSYDVPGGLWNWVVMAQVKEGTENKGAIESVVRTVRKTLLTVEPPLPLPPNSKRRMHNGWAMIDAGDFAIHILSKEAREKYFDDWTW